MGRRESKSKSTKKGIIKLSILLLIIIIFICLNITLNTRVISYNGNGATAGKMGKNVVCFNKNKVVSKNNYTKEGFDFNGWSVYDDKSEQWKCEDGWYTEAEMEELGISKSVYSEEEALEVIKNERIKNITLFAQWLDSEEESKEDLIEEDETEISKEDELVSEKDKDKVVNSEKVETKKEVINKEESPVNVGNNVELNKPAGDEDIKIENEITDLEKLSKYFIGKDLYYLFVDPMAGILEFIDDEESGILGKDILIKDNDQVFVYIKYKTNDYKIKYHKEDVNNELENRDVAVIIDEIYNGSIIKEEKDIFKIEPITENTFRIIGFTENGKELYKDKTELVIPSKIKGNNGKEYSVTEIKNFADYKFKKIIIEDGILEIADETFRGNTALEDIVLPSTLTRIGKSSFLNTGIRNVTIPSGVKIIEDSAFYGCYNLESVILPEGILNLKNSCFSQCTRLKNISLPQSLVEIGEKAFSGCQYLSKIDIPENVQRIGVSAFADCMWLSEVVIPGNVKQIEDYAFASCMSLNSIVISEGVTSIGNSVFENCSALSKIIIPGSVKVIGDSAFRLCSSLKEITILDGLTNIGNYAFALCMSLEEIKIPNTIKSIGNSVFMTCMRLSNITIKKDSTEGIYFGNAWNGNCFQQATDENGFIVFYDSSKYQVKTMSLDMDLEPEVEELEEVEEEVIEEIIDEDEILETEEVVEEKITEETKEDVVEEKLPEETKEEIVEEKLPEDKELEQDVIVTENQPVGNIEEKDVVEETVIVPEVQIKIEEIEEVAIQPIVEDDEEEISEEVVEE